jgi:predicted nucleic acid-binding protein
VEAVAAGGRETSSMNDRVFLDTNIFVYLYDSDQPAKQARARALVERFGLSGEIVISTQVLQEFYVSVTRKFARQLSEEQILFATQNLGQLPVIQVSVGMIFQAISLGRRFQLSFWDSLILQAALDSECNLLVTEDLQHGQRIGGLTVENPVL